MLVSYSVIFKLLLFFHVQVKVLAMLDHPNIISYYDSFEEDGLVMIEMEYADGGYDFLVPFLFKFGSSFFSIVCAS